MRNTPAHAPPSLIQRGARLLLTALVLLLTTANAQADVILHAFNWPYATVEARAKQIADAGYRKVLVAPAYRSEGSAWWARYQPQDIRLIDNPLGDTAAFKKMVQALANNGVETYADIVFNHMANEAATRSDLNYPGSAVLSQYAANPAVTIRCVCSARCSQTSSAPAISARRNASATTTTPTRCVITAFAAAAAIQACRISWATTGWCSNNAPICKRSRALA